MQLADRIGGVFVITVTVLAIAAFVAWYPRGVDIATANATSLLIVACPCALALPTPLAIAVSLGRAAKGKMLIRDGDVFQQLSGRGTVWLDKTGTLTEGRPRASLTFGPVDALRLAAGLERECCHPIADAILRESERLNLSMPTDDAKVEMGVGGLSGSCEGHRVAVGNESYIRGQLDSAAHADSLSQEILEQMSLCLANQSTPVIVAVDSEAIAVLAISDPVKRDAAEAVRRIRDAATR